MAETLLIAPIGELHTFPNPPPVRGEAMQATGRTRAAGLVIRNGRVVQVGSAEHVLRSHPNTEILDAANSLVTPGLVDCHTHLVWAGHRADEFIRRCSGETYEQIAKAGGGIVSTMRATRDAETEQLTALLIARAEQMLTFGTTTLEVKASYGLSLDGCKKELDAIAAARPHIRQKVVVTFMGAHAYPPDVSRQAYLEILERELLPLAAQHEVRPAFNDVFCEEGAFSVEDSRRILQTGIKHGLRPKIHSDEFNVLGGTELGVLLKAASCDHLLASGKKQIEALASSETAAVLLPGTAFYLDKAYAPARTMIDTGCIVALGTDFNPGSSQVLSMPFCLGLAVTRMHMSAEQALNAATTNAAYALAPAVEPLTGTLQVGAPADFCIWPCPTLEELIYQFTYIRPKAVFVNGIRAI